MADVGDDLRDDDNQCGAGGDRDHEAIAPRRSPGKCANRSGAPRRFTGRAGSGAGSAARDIAGTCALRLASVAGETTVPRDGVRVCVAGIRQRAFHDLPEALRTKPRDAGAWSAGRLARVRAARGRSCPLAASPALPGCGCGSRRWRAHPPRAGKRSRCRHRPPRRRRE